MPRGPKGQKRPADAVGAAVMVAKLAIGQAQYSLGIMYYNGQGVGEHPLAAVYGIPDQLRPRQGPSSFPNRPL